MLPASAVRCPPARSRCASNAVVVLLPLVPVTQTVPGTTPSAPARSPNHSAVPPTKRVPRAPAAMASALYGLIPGDFTTTSYAASRSPVASASITSPGSSARASTASEALQTRPIPPPGSRVPSPESRKARHAARPSRPHPQSATRRPSSSEMRTLLLPQRCRDAMFFVERQQRFDGQFRRIELRQDLAFEAAHQRVLAPSRSLHQRGHGGARIAAFADALERLVVLELQQRVVAGGMRRVVEQVAAEDVH